MNRFIRSISAVAFVMTATTAIAAGDHSAHMAHGAVSAQKAAMAEGEIKKVDKQARKITIKHGPIASHDMAPMTMAFGVADAAMLDHVNAGDKIRFAVERKGGAFVVTQLERAQ